MSSRLTLSKIGVVTVTGIEVVGTATGTEVAVTVTGIEVVAIATGTVVAEAAAIRESETGSDAQNIPILVSYYGIDVMLSTPLPIDLLSFPNH
jgi:hypothetical protein